MITNLLCRFVQGSVGCSVGDSRHISEPLIDWVCSSCLISQTSLCLKVRLTWPGGGEEEEEEEEEVEKEEEKEEEVESRGEEQKEEEEVEENKEEEKEEEEERGGEEEEEEEEEKEEEEEEEGEESWRSIYSVHSPSSTRVRLSSKLSSWNGVRNPRDPMWKEMIGGIRSWYINRVRSPREDEQ